MFSIAVTHNLLCNTKTDLLFEILMPRLPNHRCVIVCCESCNVNLNHKGKEKLVWCPKLLLGNFSSKLHFFQGQFVCIAHSIVRVYLMPSYLIQLNCIIFVR
jgi:hypothetical protein